MTTQPPGCHSKWYRSGYADALAGRSAQTNFDWSVTGKQIGDYEAGFRAGRATGDVGFAKAGRS